MSIFSHALIVIVLIILSSDISAIAGAWARELKLPGGNIAVFTPIIVLVIYILGIALGGINKRCRMIWALIPLFMVYPAMIFNGFSCRIETPKNVKSENFKQLKSEYGVPMIMVNNTIYVAKKDFQIDMVVRLRDISAAAPTKTETQVVTPNGP